MQDWRPATFFKNRYQHRCFPEYTVYMLDLLKDCYNCFSLFIEKHLNLPQFFISYWEKFLELIKFITIVLIYCLWIFLSTFSVFLNDYFFKWLAYKSLLSRFSVLINYIVWSYNLFSISSCFWRFSWFRVFKVQVFQGLHPGSGFRF